MVDVKPKNAQKVAVTPEVLPDPQTDWVLNQSYILDGRVVKVKFESDVYVITLRGQLKIAVSVTNTAKDYGIRYEYS